MVFSVRKWTSRILFIIVFAVLLLLATGGFRWLKESFNPIGPYHKPKGEAVKAIQTEPLLPDSLRPLERLQLFFWYGE